MASDKNSSAAWLYIFMVGAAFIGLTAVFLFFPRSTYSQLEKRDLAEFPNKDDFRNNPGGFTSAVSAWFSDSEPFRDEFMTLSMNLRGAMRYQPGEDEDAVTFRPSESQAVGSESPDGRAATDHPDEEVDPINPMAAENAKLGDSGTIIVGKGDQVRALMAFGGTSKGGNGYVDLLNTLSESFPGVNVYAMVAPLATEFYLPEKAKKCSNPQKPFIESIRSRLAPGVKFVDIYSELAKHTEEDIYLRTDHHWAGLGGFYAAKKLAETAGVPFRDLNAYDRCIIHGFVGSMYGYSKDIAIKNAPEDFVYYTPNAVDYTATYVIYTLDRNFNIIKESKPSQGQFFKKFKDGSSNAYLTFIGSDQVFVKVQTSTPGHRKLLLIKDSYGNAVPGNLFYSFNEVHVVDFRYFTHNLKQYVKDNGITDLAVCFNVFNAYSNGSASKVKKMLTQAGGVSSVTEMEKGKGETEKVKPSEKKPTQEKAISEETIPSESSETSNTSETSDPSETSNTSDTSDSSPSSTIL